MRFPASFLKIRQDNKKDDLYGVDYKDNGKEKIFEFKNGIKDAFDSFLREMFKAEKENKHVNHRTLRWHLNFKRILANFVELFFDLGEGDR